MRRIALALACPLLATTLAPAADLQKDLRSRWLGAWAVTRVEAHSDCLGGYSNNKVHGALVKGSGAFSFRAGELAKVDKVDVKRERIDVHVTLVEPVLVAYADGPFTLYRQGTCRLEYQVERPAGRRVDPAEVDRVVLRILERHEGEDGARASRTWNERVVDPYPEDYELTLARHAAWRAEQTNLAVQAKLDRAIAETARLRDRLSDDPAYLTAFARGVQQARSVRVDDCPALLGLDLPAARTSSPEARGEADGHVLVRGLELIQRLPGCFVPVPEVPEELARLER